MPDVCLDESSRAPRLRIKLYNFKTVLPSIVNSGLCSHRAPVDSEVRDVFHPSLRGVGVSRIRVHFEASQGVEVPSAWCGRHCSHPAKCPLGRVINLWTVKEAGRKREGKKGRMGGAIDVEEEEGASQRQRRAHPSKLWSTFLAQSWFHLRFCSKHTRSGRAVFLGLCWALKRKSLSFPIITDTTLGPHSLERI